jgi:nucleoporin GLE1
MPRETTQIEIEPGNVIVEKMSELPEKQKLKRVGAKAEEGLEVQMMRVTGVLRLYFTMLFEDSAVPLPPQYRKGRWWAYLATVLNDEMVLKRPIAPEAIYGENCFYSRLCCSE